LPSDEPSHAHQRTGFIIGQTKKGGQNCEKQRDLPKRNQIVHHPGCTPNSVLASLPGVSFFDGVINVKTPDFSLFSLHLKISLHFRRPSRMPFLPLPSQRRIPALARSPVLSNTWGHGAASPAGGIPFGRSYNFQGTVVSRQVQFNEKSGLFPYIQEVGK